MPPDSVMILLSACPTATDRAAPFRGSAGFGGLPNRPRLKLHRRPHGLERVGRQLLRHQADLRARGAVVAHDVVAVGQHRAARSALTMPQMMLISVVLPAPFGPSSAKISPRRIVEVDVLQRLEARGVGLADVADRNDGVGHAGIVPAPDLPHAFGPASFIRVRRDGGCRCRATGTGRGTSA